MKMLRNFDQRLIISVSRFFNEPENNSILMTLRIMVSIYSLYNYPVYNRYIRDFDVLKSHLRTDLDQGTLGPEDSTLPEN
jgi:hypothetical protein